MTSGEVTGFGVWLKGRIVVVSCTVDWGGRLCLRTGPGRPGTVMARLGRRDLPVVRPKPQFSLIPLLVVEPRTVCRVSSWNI